MCMYGTGIRCACTEMHGTGTQCACTEMHGTGTQCVCTEMHANEVRCAWKTLKCMELGFQVQKLHGKYPPYTWIASNWNLRI